MLARLPSGAAVCLLAVMCVTSGCAAAQQQQQSPPPPPPPSVVSTIDTTTDELWCFMEQAIWAKLQPLVSRLESRMDELSSRLDSQQSQLDALVTKMDDIPKYSMQLQLDDDNIPESWLAHPRPREMRRIHCNYRAEDNKMLMGISDDDGFTDIDQIKCVHSCSIRLGEERDLDVPKYSNALVNCGNNEVMTAFGASDQWMETIIRVTCTCITAGATVSDNCQEITITADQGRQRDFLADVRWPAQCPSSNEEISVITGIAFNEHTSPKWQRLRCCQLRRTLSDLP